MHKRISTSIERSQAEPGECLPAGPGQSLSPTREDGAGPKGHEEEEKDVPQETKRKLQIKANREARKPARPTA